MRTTTGNAGQRHVLHYVQAFSADGDARVCTGNR